MRLQICGPHVSPHSLLPPLPTVYTAGSAPRERKKRSRPQTCGAVRSLCRCTCPAPVLFPSCPMTTPRDHRYGGGEFLRRHRDKELCRWHESAEFRRQPAGVLKKSFPSRQRHACSFVLRKPPPPFAPFQHEFFLIIISSEKGFKITSRSLRFLYVLLNREQRVLSRISKYTLILFAP